MTREHLVIGELIEPQKPDLYLWENGAWYVRDSEVKRLRDEDRRIYRKWMICLVVLQLFAAGLFRFGVELLMTKAAKNPELSYLLAYRNAILISMICLVVLMWTVGIWSGFRRRYQ